MRFLVHRGRRVEWEPDFDRQRTISHAIIDDNGRRPHCERPKIEGDEFGKWGDGGRGGLGRSGCGRRGLCWRLGGRGRFGGALIDRRRARWVLIAASAGAAEEGKRKKQSNQWGAHHGAMLAQGGPEVEAERLASESDEYPPAFTHHTSGFIICK